MLKLLSGGGDFFRKYYQPFSKTLISTEISTHGLSSFQKKHKIKNKTVHRWYYYF